MYLYGITFVIVTDHKPLEFIFNRKMCGTMCARVERWALGVQNITFKVKCQPVLRECRIVVPKKFERQNVEVSPRRTSLYCKDEAAFEREGLVA